MWKLNILYDSLKLLINLLNLIFILEKYKIEALKRVINNYYSVKKKLFFSW
jgi:hypothetical protein